MRFLRIAANIIALAAAAAAGVVLSVGDPAQNRDAATWGTVLAAVALILQIGLVVHQERTRSAAKELSTRYQTVMNNSMMPVLRSIAHMGSMTPTKRKAEVTTTATQIVNSVIQVLAQRHSEARATAFMLDTSAQHAGVVASFGSALLPEPIDMSTDRGQLARKLMDGSSRVFESVKDNPDAWLEKDTEYDGRIVCPISVQDRDSKSADVYGLLMYEVFDGKQLTKGDKDVVDVFASAAATAISLL